MPVVVEDQLSGGYVGRAEHDKIGLVPHPHLQADDVAIEVLGFSQILAAKLRDNAGYGHGGRLRCGPGLVDATWSLPGSAVDGLAEEVRVARVAGRLLDEVQQNPPQRESPPLTPANVH